MRYFYFLIGSLAICAAADDLVPSPLPIDPLWESASFRKSVTGSYGIDSRIEPRITTDEEFYLDAAAKLMANQDRSKAIATLTESSLLSESPAMQFMLGSLLFEEGELEEAAPQFENALKAFPNFRDAHRNLAIVRVQLEEWEKAKGHLIRAMELGSREAVTMGLLGYCHSVAGHHQAALDAYRVAALSSPEERQWRLGQAQALQALGEGEKTIQIYGEILADHPADWSLWLNRADGLMAQDRPIEAIAHLEASRRAGALSAEGLLSLGHLFLQNDLPPLALARYDEAFFHPSPPSPAKRIETLEYLTQLELFSEAQALITEHTDLFSETGSEPILEGRWSRVGSLVEIKVGDAKNGAAQLESWLAKEPMDGQALLLLGQYREGTGEREVAEMLYEQATGIPESAAKAHRAWGSLLLAKKDHKAAIEQWEKSLTIEDNPSLKEYLEAVREWVD